MNLVVIQFCKVLRSCDAFFYKIKRCYTWKKKLNGHFNFALQHCAVLHNPVINYNSHLVELAGSVEDCGGAWCEAPTSPLHWWRLLLWEIGSSQTIFCLWPGGRKLHLFILLQIKAATSRQWPGGTETLAGSRRNSRFELFIDFIESFAELEILYIGDLHVGVDRGHLRADEDRSH